MKPSLRRRLARRILLPLALMWLLATGTSMGIAYHYTAQAFDRALLDDAYTLADNIQFRANEPALNLTPVELKNLLRDHAESVFYSVRRSSDGSLVSGHGWLKVTHHHLLTPYEFSDWIGEKMQPLRVVSMMVGDDLQYQVTMAQTTRSRTALLQNLLQLTLIPQAFLLILLAWWLRRGVDADLQPLSELQRVLGERDATDLTPLRIVAQSRDVDNLCHALNALMERIAAGVQAQREFAGNVAHELRTPLAGIRALVEYGLHHTDAAVWRHQLEAIAASEAHASHMVQQLLALALADEQRENLRLHPVALHELVPNIVLKHLDRADALGVELAVMGCDTDVVLLSDEGLLEGILVNLLDNALRYGRAVAPVHCADAAIITIAVEATKNYCGLWVIDNGAGIEPEQRARLMQRWQRASRGSGIEIGRGAGLGLSIVARYATLLGAEFVLRDPPAWEGITPHGLCAGLVWQRDGMMDKNGYSHIGSIPM